LKYLTFMLADQFCGIDLASVREVLGYMSFVPVAAEHPAIVGQFDLRGQSVRVLDLRLRFGLPAMRTDETEMLVVDLAHERLAVIVDKTVSLENLQSISPALLNGRSRIDPACIVGSARIKDRPLLLLDAARALSIIPPLPKAA